MHAFIFVGVKVNTEDIISKLPEIDIENIIDYPIRKIEDVRELGKFTKFSQSYPIFIKIENIDKATPEAQNSLLKSLEEPTMNINYILTAESEGGVLPTILSRCMVFNVFKKNEETLEGFESFIKSETYERIAVIEKIKDREEAIGFIKSLIFYFHGLIKDGENSGSLSKNLQMAQKTSEAIKKNGNTYLQLANFAINIQQIFPYFKKAGS